MLKAKYIHEDYGNDFSQKNCKEHLKLNCEYEVESVWMGQSSTTIGLKDFQKIPFNSVHFIFIEDGKEIDIYEDPSYNLYLRKERGNKWN